METKKTSHTDVHTLKSLDFLSWRVNKAKQKLHKQNVNRQLSARPRLRRDDVTKH